MGPEVLLLLGKQCSQMGPEYCMTGAADSLEWVTMLDASILSMAFKWPAVLLRKLLNTSAGSYVLLLEILSIVLDRPSISHERCYQSLGLGHISVLAVALN
jgi:hypothetical protein